VSASNARIQDGLICQVCCRAVAGSRPLSHVDACNGVRVGLQLSSTALAAAAGL
jgi:hypothetical protein